MPRPARVLLALVLTSLLCAPTRALGPAPIFRYDDPFWVNLHHFLYVLGRVEAKMPDIRRRAVAGAPADQAAGLATLTEAERKTWAEAVAVYAEGLSRKDSVFDDEPVRAVLALREVADPATRLTAATGVDAATASALEKAAPIYRKAWWDKHAKANDARRSELRALVEAHGRKILNYILRVYQEEWPGEGRLLHLSGYTNWAGAYSTRGSLLVLSSLDEGTSGFQGLEIAFHEAMHQWDPAMAARLEAAAKRLGRPAVPEGLSHALIFYTAGEAVRSAVPAHEPYAEKNGIWRRGLDHFKTLLDREWKPYLEGRGSLDEALEALLRAAEEKK